VCDLCDLEKSFCFDMTVKIIGLLFSIVVGTYILPLKKSTHPSFYFFQNSVLNFDRNLVHRECNKSCIVRKFLFLSKTQSALSVISGFILHSRAIDKTKSCDSSLNLNAASIKTSKHALFCVNKKETRWLYCTECP